MKKTKTKCYLYTRVSTSMQVDGYSLDAQRDKLRKYAEYEDMVVAGEYSDEGFSGKNIQGRHEFQRMLQDIQDCKDGVEYVLVFKLSRFGRNAADVLNSLQLMQDFGVNLICVEDGIDSSKDSGKLMISVLSAVAEIERENIRTQTMAGREQKAREGKWNGGFAPYGYRLEKGELLIAEDEVDVIRTIFDRYIHTNDGVSGVAKYLNRQGFVKKLRQNGTIPGFSASFVKSIIDNPVYMGKIAYGRRRTEKKIGTRNEMHVVEQSEFPVYEGKHEAIISEEDWNLAQEKRKINAYRREKVNDPTHAHILSGILKCPCCGKSLYGNIAKAHSKDKKTRYYYYCKNTVTPTGHECTFRLNIEQTEMNRMVASIISAMVSDPRFANAIKAKIGSAVDTNDLEKQLEALQAQLRQTLGTKARLERQMDGLDVNDPYYDRKISDLQRRYDEQYGAIDEIEVQIDDVQSQIRSIRQEKISGDNIYRLLLAFDQVYEAASEVERKEFMRAFIERIELFPEKQPDGNWIRKIIFNFPVPVNGTEVTELPLENETMVDPERAKGNIYWDCFHGFRSALDPQDPDDLATTFSDVERQFYETHYTAFVESQNERNARIRHTERNRSIPDLLSSRKTCPEETIYQLGTLDEHTSAEDLLSVVTEFIEKFKAKYGDHVHVLDWALHLDESTPHIHERHVFDCENKYGEVAPQQEKALESLGFDLPDPDKPLSRRNNRKISFDAACRKMLFEIAKRHGLDLEEEAEYGNRKYLEKQDFILAKQKEQLAAQQNKLDKLTLKVSDMETLLEDVSAAAYDKAVEVVTDVVRTETRKEDMRMIEDTKKWVLSPERKSPYNAQGKRMTSFASVFVTP